MADEDNFEIDIYGDGEGMDEDSKAFYKQEMEKDLALKETKREAAAKAENAVKQEQESKSTTETPSSKVKQETGQSPNEDVKPKMQQGVKRKGESDERRIDAGATNAVMISDLHWWTTEDDIRGWINDAGAEDELKDITFSEHKVNGKSKGQVYLEFTSPQASTASKHKIETVSSGPAPSSRKFTVAFHNASSNPFKTLPKDAPARAKDERPQRAGSTPYSGPAHNDYNSTRGSGGGGGFRGRGGYNNNNNRGNYNQNNYNNNNNNNRNFNGPMGGNNGGGFQGNGFGGGGGGGNMPMNNFNNNFNPRGGGMMNNNFRGGGGGMRGRGGGPVSTGNMMPMNMGMMGGPMNMNPMMMAGMGPQGFGGNPPFGMFNQGGQGMNGGGDWGSNKRPRHE